MIELQVLTSIIDSASLAAIVFALWRLDRRIVQLEQILTERHQR
jgi:hypothetical protein